MESSIILQRCNTYRFTGTYYCLHFIIHCCSTESQGNRVHPTVVCNISIVSLCKFTRICFLTLTRTLGQLSYPNEDVRVRKRIRVNLYCWWLELYGVELQLLTVVKICTASGVRVLFLAASFLITRVLCKERLEAGEHVPATLRAFFSSAVRLE